MSDSKEAKPMLWFHVMDMHSGGRAKFKKDGADVDHFFIEAADHDAAIERFTRKTGRDVDYVTCECCGSDYSDDSIGEATLDACAAFWMDNCDVKLDGPSVLVLRVGDEP